MIKVNGSLLLLPTTSNNNDEAADEERFVSVKDFASGTTSATLPSAKNLLIIVILAYRWENIKFYVNK